MCRIYGLSKWACRHIATLTVLILEAPFALLSSQYDPHRDYTQSNHPATEWTSSVRPDCHIYGNLLPICPGHCMHANEVRFLHSSSSHIIESEWILRLSRPTRSQLFIYALAVPFRWHDGPAQSRPRTSKSKLSVGRLEPCQPRMMHLPTSSARLLWRARLDHWKDQMIRCGSIWPC
jgi:hypothetical protein